MASTAVRTSLTKCESSVSTALIWSLKEAIMRSVNVIEGEPNDRVMTTGNHTVRDIYCCKCGRTLGWKYVCPLLLLHWPLSKAYDRGGRTEHMSSPRSIRRASSSSNGTSLPTCNDRWPLTQRVALLGQPLG